MSDLRRYKSSMIVKNQAPVFVLGGDANALFHFARKIIRRYPVNSRGATYHVTEWDDDILLHR